MGFGSRFRHANADEQVVYQTWVVQTQWNGRSAKTYSFTHEHVHVEDDPYSWVVSCRLWMAFVKRDVLWNLVCGQYMGHEAC